MLTRDRVAWGVLSLQLVICGAALFQSGMLNSVQTYDSVGYRQMSWSSVSDIFGGIRTPGYPAYLSLLDGLAPGLDLIAAGHFVAYSIGILVFYSGLVAATGSALHSAAAASAAIYTRILFGYVSVIATDTFAAGLALAVCGMLLRHLAAPGKRNSLVLAILVACAWLVRPAYLFLIPFVPLAAWAAYPTLAKRSSKSRAWHAQTGLLLVVFPLVAYCSLRLVTVGRFGIVSFGGFNLIGIAGQFLTDRDVPSLSPDLHTLARTAIERRRIVPPADPELAALPTTNYARMEAEYDPTIWRVFNPQVAEQTNQSAVELNSKLRRLAQELIRLHPREYLIWVIKAVRQATRKIAWDFADNPFGFLLVAFSVTAIAVRSMWNRTPAACIPASPSLALCTRLALLYCLLNLAVVIPVCPPLGRFTDSATLLLACPVTVLLIDSVRSTSPASKTQTS